MKTDVIEILGRASVVGTAMLGAFFFFRTAKPLTGIFIVMIAMVIALLLIARLIFEATKRRTVNERPTHWLTEPDYEEEARQISAPYRAAARTDAGRKG